MRIVGGRHSGRRLAVPRAAGGGDAAALRPTADRARQAVFDVLVHGGLGPEDGDAVAGAVVLDAFCGTGALGIEALSRGAAEAWFLDTAAPALAAVRQSLTALNEVERATVLRADATTPPRFAGRSPASLALLDPPYGQDLAAPALTALAARGWLGEGCLCVVELGRRDAFAPPSGFAVLDDRRYGEAHMIFLRRTP